MPVGQSPPDPLNALFRDTVFVLGGIFATREADDETVRRVAIGLERAFRRARGEELPGPDGTDLRPHRALAALLSLTDLKRCDQSEESPAVVNLPEGFERIPGLYRRWEVELVLKAGQDLHLEDAGTAADGTPLLAVYQRAAKTADNRGA